MFLMLIYKFRDQTNTLTDSDCMMLHVADPAARNTPSSDVIVFI